MAIFWNDGTELYHYGIPGQKWGIRRWQNADGSFNEAGKIRYGRIKTSNTRLLPGDVVINKGHKFERLYTKVDNFNNDDYKAKRLYVSDNALSYANDYFINSLDKTMIQTLVSNKNMIFAGKEAINDALNQIGELPLGSYYDSNSIDEHGNINITKVTDPDFLLNNSKIGEKFIKQIIKNGYSGVRDPLDDIDIGYSNTAKIIFELSDVTITDDKLFTR